MRLHEENAVLEPDGTESANPPAQARVRLADMVEPLWQIIAKHLVEPVKVTHSGSTRQVEFMGILTFQVDPDGQRVILCRNENGSSQPLHAQFDLLRPVSRWFWLDQLLEQDGLNPSWFADVYDALKGRVWKITSLRALAAQVRTALALDNHPAHAIALRSRPQKSPDGLMAKHFNLVWMYLDAFRIVERENPQLLPVLALALEKVDFELGDDPVASLKQYLLAQGITQAGWRLLVKIGYRGIAPAIARYDERDRLKIVVWYAHELAKAGVRTEPSRHFMRTWLQLIERGDSIGKGWHGHPIHVLRTTFNALAQCTTPEAVRQFTLDFLMVDQWVLSRPTFDANQKKMPWHGLVERARTREKIKTIELQCGGLHWPCPLPAYEEAGYRIVPIVNAVDLFEEGARMRHCVFDLLDECLSGMTLCFSLRQAETGKRVATLKCAFRSGFWYFEDASIFANHDADTGIRNLGQECAHRLNQALRDQAQRLTAEIVLKPASTSVSQTAHGRVEWLVDVHQDAASPPKSEEDEDEYGLPEVMAAIVAQAHGEGQASAADWSALYQSLYFDNQSSDGYCLALSENNIPSPDELLEYLESELDVDRFNALRSHQASVSQAEWDSMRKYWIDATLQNPDCDLIYSYVILEITDHNARTAYLLAQVGGYSFTHYVFRLDGLFQFKCDVIEAIRQRVLPEAFAAGEFN